MQKYLLYIDILGFSNLVQSDESKIQKIYSVLDDLNVHRHDGFKTIGFSDTILVYNNFVPKSDHDHQYIVMFMCEFAQDLLYRSFLHDVFFRSVLVHGNFNHYDLKNIDCFYGTALITAYLKEKNITGIGLYIDSFSNSKSDIFFTEKYDNDFYFVYLQQRLDVINERILLKKPYIDSFCLDQEFVDYYAIEETAILKKIFLNMDSHPDPKVRSKFLSTWHMLNKRYSRLINILLEENFNHRAFNERYNWSTAERKFDYNDRTSVFSGAQ